MTVDQPFVVMLMKLGPFDAWITAPRSQRACDIVRPTPKSCRMVVWSIILLVVAITVCHSYALNDEGDFLHNHFTQFPGFKHFALAPPVHDPALHLDEAGKLNRTISLPSGWTSTV